MQTGRLAPDRILKIHLCVLCVLGWPTFVSVGHVRSGYRRQLEFPRAVTEGLDLIHTERVDGGEHCVGHRRAVRRLEVQAALERAAGLAGEEQRAALVIVDV